MKKISIIKGTKLKPLFLAGVLIALALALPFTVKNMSPGVEARTRATDYNPSAIISDFDYFNNRSMSARDIQNFLNRHDSTCLKNYRGLALVDANRNGQIEDWTPQEKYGGPTGTATMSAAQLIKVAADTYGINPQVLIVTLQKEQGLITRKDCPEWRYNTAFGFGCPDTAPCDRKAYGFTRQLDNAAYHFKFYTTGKDKFNNPVYATFWPGRSNIQWHPNARCGTSSVNITTKGTAALYTYTPYRPNRAALNAGYGIGDSCSSYGNRNFFLYFNDWFGSNFRRDVKFEPMDVPRWMQSAKSQRKTDLTNDRPAGATVLSPGQQVKFVDKTTIDGVLYLRTKWDRDNNRIHGIKIADLREIPVTPTETTVIQTTRPGRKLNPATGVRGASYAGGEIIFANSSMNLGGKTYRTNIRDANPTNNTYVEPENYRVLGYEKFVRPRNMSPVNGAVVVNPFTGQTQRRLTANNALYFVDKILINGQWYFRTEEDSRANRHSGVSSRQLREVSFLRLSAPLDATLKVQSSKFDTRQNTNFRLFPVGTRARVVDYTVVNGIKYYRTEWDATRGNMHAFPESSLTLSSTTKPAEFIPMAKRTMTLVTRTQKINPFTNTMSGLAYGPNRVIEFSDQITINGQTFYRTTWDSARGNNLAFPLSALR